MERELGVDSHDFRRWVCLHEETHQFTAVPWLRDYVQSQMTEFLLASELDPAAIPQRLQISSKCERVYVCVALLGSVTLCTVRKWALQLLSSLQECQTPIAGLPLKDALGKALGPQPGAMPHAPAVAFQTNRGCEVSREISRNWDSFSPSHQVWVFSFRLGIMTAALSARQTGDVSNKHQSPAPSWQPLCRLTGESPLPAVRPAGHSTQQQFTPNTNP